MTQKFLKKDGESLRVVFMGTPAFAVPSLEKLLDATKVVGVFTQPDRPKGRGQKIKPSAVKTCAEKNELAIYQPRTLKTDDVLETLKNLAPDLIVVVAFGQILPQRILDLPPYGCINVHASLLPKYRGAAPMEYALMHGEKETGITTMLMDRGLDTGDILLKTAISISDEMNFGELHDLLMKKGAELLLETIDLLLQGRIERIKQNDEEHSYAPMLDKNTGKIDWHLSSKRLHDLVRALDPHIGAFSYLGDTKIKIFRTRISDIAPSKIGEIVAFTKEGFLVGTGEGSLEILELQAPGKKRMRAKDYLLGHQLKLGACFT